MATVNDLARKSASIWRNHTFTLIFASALVIIFAVSIWLTIELARPSLKDGTANTIRVEIIKSLLQLALVIVLGGVIAALFKVVEQNREQARLRAATRAAYLERLGKIYRTVKATRRALRAAGLTTYFPTSNRSISINIDQIALYKTQRERLNEAQLELEALKIEARSHPVFASLQEVYHRLKHMEKYVRDVLKEFEEVYPLLQSGQPVAPNQLRYLDEFTGHTHEGSTGKERRFEKDFARCYDHVISIISTHQQQTVASQSKDRNRAGKVEGTEKHPPDRR